MSDKVTVYGTVTIQFSLEDIFVEDALSKESVEEKVDSVIEDHLGMHDYTFGPKWTGVDVTTVVDDWESA